MKGNERETREQIYFVDPKEAEPILYRMDEGLSYGLGLFETILIREKAHFLEDHLHRLNQSLKRFGFDCFVGATAVEDLIQTHSLRNTGLKLIVTEKNLFATVRPIPYDLQSNQMGQKVTISRVIRSKHSQLISHKTLNYGENILELRRAKETGYDDCLFVNEDGHVTESAIANLFMIYEDKIITPSIADGLLPGIIRKKVMEKYQVYEEHINIEQLKSCQGAFLTNSLLSAMPISYVEDVHLPRHPVCDELISFFKVIV